MFYSIKKTLLWFRALRLYSSNDLYGFISLANRFDEAFGESPYRNAIKATALLRLGRDEEAKAVFESTISAKGESTNLEYIRLFSAARLAGLQGNAYESDRLDHLASSLQCSKALKRRLPTM